MEEYESLATDVSVLCPVLTYDVPACPFTCYFHQVIIFAAMLAVLPLFYNNLLFVANLCRSRLDVHDS